MRMRGRCVLLGLCLLLSLPAVAAPVCTALFSTGVQSHSSSGRVDFGYKSRVNGSGPTVMAPSLTMTHTYQDQAALCDGVVCTATGTTSTTSTPTFLTGSEVPASFQTGSAVNGAITLGYQQVGSRNVGDYGAVSVGQQARLTFASVGATYRTKALTTQYQSVVEFQPGDYWIDGDVNLAEQTILRRLTGGTGPVRLYVKGSINTGLFSLEGFAQGQIYIYATGDISMGNNAVIPGYVHARGSVTFGQNPIITGGVFAGSYATGNNAQITYSAVGASNRMGSFTADHQAVVQMQPGDYWYNGNFTLNQVTLRRLSGDSGPVRIFVNGQIDIKFAARFEGFAAGQLLIYSTQNIAINSQQRVPAFIYAAGDINIGYQSGVDGAVAGRVVSIGQESVVNYVAPNDLAPLCDPAPVRTCLTDNFNRTNLGAADWAVTSRNGSFGVPRIIGNRLRLTDNSGNVATGATLQRLLPAAGNLVEIEFKYYAYSGNGADGVAVIFSDASKTPQPGGYGGSLGYAQLNGTSGFAGGWLGIALDEYGNFSSPSETRVGGPGLLRDSVSIRGSGSGTNGYPYLRGTAAALNPGVDVSGSTAGPGHTYRIVLDSRTSGATLVSVERNTGSGFNTLIAPFNAQTSSQAELPANFFMSLTGSTGGSNNIHELDDLQVCATQINPVGQQIDHFELSHLGNALTCNPLAVTVKACVDNAVPCTTPYTGTNPALTATLSPNGWSGLNFSAGVANAQLAVRTASTVRLNVDSSTPPLTALSRTWCKSGAGAWGTGAACDVTFSDSGFNFIFDPSATSANAPIRMIAASPAVSGKIQAVKKDATNPVCVPAFKGVRRIGFRAAYLDPTTTQTQPLGIANLPIVVNGSDVTHTASTNLDLTFDDTGSAPLTLRYSDAGKVSLTASYSGTAANGDAGLSMASSTEVRSRPYGLCIRSESACTVAGVGDNCTPFPGNIRAGDSFALRLQAVGWQSNGEALTAAALCTGNPVTPKFAMPAIALSSVLVAPAGGSNGSVGPATYNHVLGSQTTADTSISEVGVFNVVATPAPNYLGSEIVSASTSGLLGRFIPAYLRAAGSASLTPSCGSVYSYQGQPMAFASGQEPRLTVTGANRQGAITSNYDRGDFWRLNVPARDAYVSVITARANLNARLSAQGSATTAVLDAVSGDGAKSFGWSGEQLAYNPGLLPVGDDFPATATVRQGFSAAALTDQDGACYLGAGTSCAAFSFEFGGSDVRLGRLRIGNAHGSELQNLTLPVALESWQSVAGGSFQNEGLDTCTTAAVLGPVALDGYTGNLDSGETVATSTPPAAGIVGSLLLSAPGNGNDGSVQARYQGMPNWLHFAWDGVTRSEARGLASFGIYKGATPLIFRREVYR